MTTTTPTTKFSVGDRVAIFGGFGGNSFCGWGTVTQCRVLKDRVKVFVDDRHEFTGDGRTPPGKRGFGGGIKLDSPEVRRTIAVHTAKCQLKKAALAHFEGFSDQALIDAAAALAGTT